MSTSLAAQSPLTKSAKIKWVIIIVILAAMFTIPVSETFTQEVKYFLIVTIAALFLMATELLPSAIAALIIPIGYWAFNVAGTTTIFKAWTSETPWLLVGSLLVTQVLSKTGLNKRLAYGLMLLGKGKYHVVMFMLLPAGYILTCFVPTPVARMVLFCSIGMSLIDAMGWKPGSREAVTTFGLLLVAGSSANYLIMTGANSSLTMASVMESAGYPITWLQWAAYNFLPGLIQTLAMFFGTIFIFRKLESSDGPDNQRSSQEIQTFIRGEYDKLGKLSKDEIKSTVIFGVIVVGLLTGSWHSFTPGKVLMIMAIVCFLPGLKLLDGKDVKKTNFSAVLLLASCVAIGDVASSLGLGDLMVAAVLPYLPTTLVGLVAVAFFICFFGNLIMTPMAIASALGLPMITIAEACGLNVQGFIMVFITSCSAVVFPYEANHELLAYGYGQMPMKSFIKFSVMRTLILLVGRFVLYIPWFSLLGLL